MLFVSSLLKDYTFMKFSKYLTLFLLIPLFAFTLHKYYVSLCEIEYVEEQQSIQIILGLFTDDIEFSLNKDHQTKLHIGAENEIENVDAYFEDYLNNNFKIIVNEELKTYKFIGKEYDDDIVRFYLEILAIKELKSIEVLNTCLLRDFDEQQNIIKIKVKKLHKSFYLDNKNANCLLKI